MKTRWIALVVLLGAMNAHAARRSVDVRPGDSLMVVSDQGPVNITWKQSLVTYTRTFDRLRCITNLGANVLVFKERGVFKKNSYHIGRVLTVKPGMRYVGRMGAIVAIVVGNKKNYIFQKRFTSALPRTWAQWARDQLSVKDVQSAFRIATQLRGGAKKAALKTLSKIVGKRAGKALRTTVAVVDPMAYVASWSGKPLGVFQPNQYRRVPRVQQRRVAPPAARRPVPRRAAPRRAAPRRGKGRLYQYDK